MYTKIWINGPEDLPKEDGLYIVKKRGCAVSEDLFNSIGDPYAKEHWLNHFDWYLIEQDIIMPSEEDLTKQAHKDYPYSDVEWNTTTIERQIWMDCAKWMKSEIERLNKDNIPLEHKTLEDSGYSFETGV